jgi:hypothetical protein
MSEFWQGMIIGQFIGAAIVWSIILFGPSRNKK